MGYPPDTGPDPFLGTLLDDRYRIVEVLGRGGIGIVYRAQQRHVHDRDVAIKVLSTAASVRASTARRFENEARIIARLRHPNTLKLIDTGRTADGRLYIVTECLDGIPLSERLMHRWLSPLEAVRVAEQIAASLTEAHELGVVHRDLKPPNIFLEQVGSQEVVKVLDFGIAKLVHEARLTAPMQIFGTPGFMAPEQCLGDPVDGRADLYGLGALTYLAMTGQLPVPGESVEELLAATIEVPAQPLRRHFPGGLEPELEGLIMQLLAKAPGDRLPDATAVREACERIVRTLERTAAVALPGTPQAPSGPYARTPPPTPASTASTAEVAPVDWVAEDLEQATAATEAPTARAPAHDTDPDPVDPTHQLPAGSATRPDEDEAPTVMRPPGAAIGLERADIAQESAGLVVARGGKLPGATDRREPKAMRRAGGSRTSEIGAGQTDRRSRWRPDEADYDVAPTMVPGALRSTIDTDPARTVRALRPPEEDPVARRQAALRNVGIAVVSAVVVAAAALAILTAWGG